MRGSGRDARKPWLRMLAVAALGIGALGLVAYGVNEWRVSTRAAETIALWQETLDAARRADCARFMELAAQAGRSPG